MTRAEMNAKLVIDVTRILIESGDLKGPWSSCVVWSDTQLSTIETTQKLITKLEACKKTTVKYTDVYVAATIKLLQLRIADNITDRSFIVTKSQRLLMEDEIIVQLKSTGETVIQYTDYERSNFNTRTIEQKIEKNSGLQVEVTVEPVEPGNYREKSRYLNHSIWAVYPNLPIIKVKLIA